MEHTQTREFILVHFFHKLLTNNLNHDILIYFLKGIYEKQNCI